MSTRKLFFAAVIFSYLAVVGGVASVLLGWHLGLLPLVIGLINMAYLWVQILRNSWWLE